VETLVKEKASPNIVERILFSPVELWAVVVLFLFGCVVAIGFGAAVLDAERETSRFGARFGGKERVRRSISRRRSESLLAQN